MSLFAVNSTIVYDLMNLVELRFESGKYPVGELKTIRERMGVGLS
jgi:hypothetical protein